MTKSGDDIRSAILGADRPFRTLEDRDGGGDRRRFPDRPRDDVPPCPLVPLGDRSGVYYFLDPIGQERHITARGFGNKGEVRGLFRGSEEWLRQCFPEYEKGSRGSGEAKVVSFQVDWAAAWLQQFCCAQGLFNESLRFRRPGIWRGDDGLPIVHCGDVVMIEGKWQPAGVRTGSQFWIAASPTARPSMPCGADVGTALVQSIQDLWRFEHPGAPHLLVGFVGCALLGTAIWWRPDVLLTGVASAGKSSLARVLRAACPMHAHSNDTTESGIMGKVTGHVMPIFLDEAFDRLDQDVALRLLDMILGMSSGDGAVKTRGTADGRFRENEMAGCVLFASESPPAMRQTHLGRVTIFEMLSPGVNADHESRQRALIDWTEARGPGLWGRVISSAPRWTASLPLFRDALAKAGCAPREMDQMGALLAGWWILTKEGLPDERGVLEALGVARAFIRTAADVELDSAPRQAVRHLASRLLQYDGTTRKELVSVLLDRAWRPESDDTIDEKQSIADRVLLRHGLRAVRPCETYFVWTGERPGQEEWQLRDAKPPGPDDPPCQCKNCFNKRFRKYIPRLGPGAAVWIGTTSAAPLFKDAPGLEGDRWRTGLLRRGRPSQGTVRIGASERAIWLPREEIDDGGG
jgi:hypothetical protein